MTEEQLDTLKDNYAYLIVDGMDMKSLITFAVETVAHNLETWTEDEIKEEILLAYDQETLDDLLAKW